MGYTKREFASGANSLTSFDSPSLAAGAYDSSAQMACNDEMVAGLTAIKGAGGLIQSANALNNGNTITSLSATFTGPNTAGNCIVVDFMWNWLAGLATPTCADSQGNSYTPIFQRLVGGGLCAACQFVAFGIKVGANTVTVSFPPPGPLEVGSGDGPCIAIHEYVGGTAVDTSVNGQLVPGPGSLPLSVTTTAAGDLLHLFYAIVAACAGSPFNVTGGSPLNPPFLTPSWLLVNEPPSGSPATGGGITDRSKFLFLGQGAQHTFNLQLRQRGTASYTLVSSPNDPTSAPLDYLPTLFQPIYLYDQNNEVTDWPGSADGWSLVFAGIIQDYTVRWVGTKGLRFIDVSAVSLEAVFDTIYCDGTDEFVNQTCGAILTALYDKYENGCPVSLGTIQAGATIPRFTPEKGQKLSEMFEQLATTSQFIWGVNPSTQTLFFEAPTTTVAPFDLASTQSLWDSISNKIDGADYRNRQGIKLSDTAFPQSGETFIGSGQQTLTLMRPVKQVVSAYATLGTPNFATLTFSGQPSPGDTFSIGPNDQGWSVHNSGGTNPWVVGTVIVVAGYLFQCTTGGVSAATQPTAFLTQTTIGDTVTDGVAIWTCQGSYTTGNGGQITWTWVSALDNTQAFQVLIGATLAASVQNAVDAINNAAPYGGPPATNGRGLTISLPEWENGQVNANYVSGTQLKVTNIQDAAPGISALSTVSSSFSWSSPQTEGGNFPQGSLGPNEPGTISLQVYEQGTSTASPGLAYTPGSAVVTLATPLNAGSQLNVYYIRADAGSIEVEDTALVAQVAAASHGTGKIQQFSDQSELGIISTSATAGLQFAQQVLEAFDVLPMFLDVILYQPGILPGQLWTWDLDDPWSVLNGQYFVQEIKAELVPTFPWLDNPNALGAGHYRYTIRVVDAAQAQSYLDTWEGFAGGSSSGGGAGSSTVPTSGGAVSTQGNYGPALETNGTLNSSQALLDLVASTGITLTDAGGGMIEIAASGASPGGTVFSVYDETPSGTINGSNTAFTLANSPSPAASLQLFQNGILAVQGIDYTLSGSSITMTSAPSTGAILTAYYRYASAGGTFVDDETPGGAVNGSNVTFTLANIPNPSNSLRLYQNGVLAIQGTDYTLAGLTITMTSAPSSGAEIVAYYVYLPSSSNYADNETPGGAVNGSNTAFTLANAPTPATSLNLYINGILQLYGTDFTLSGSSITMTHAPSTGAILRAFYRY